MFKTIINKIKIYFNFNYLHRSDFVNQVAETFSARVLLIGIGLITSVIMARILGPEGRGLYAVAGTIGAIGVQFANLGLHASNTYFVAQDRSLLPSLTGNTILAGFGLGGLVAAAIWIVFCLWPDLAPVNGLLLILSLLWIPFGLLYMLFQNILLGIQEVRAYNLIELVSRIFLVVLIGLVILFKTVTAETVFSAGLVALLVSFIWALWQISRHIEGLPLPSWPLFKNCIGYGLKAYLAAFFSFMVLKADMLMVKGMLDSTQVGYYSIAVTMADMVLTLPLVISTILFPKLSAIKDHREKWLMARKVAQVTGILMIPVVLVALLLANPIIRILFGDAFLPAVPTFVWLMPGIVCLSIGTIFQNYMGAAGNAVGMIYGPLVASVLNIVINLYSIKNFGIAGATYSSTISYAVLALISYFMSRRTFCKELRV